VKKEIKVLGIVNGDCLQLHILLPSCMKISNNIIIHASNQSFDGAIDLAEKLGHDYIADAISIDIPQVH